MSVRANRRWEPHEVLRTALTVCDKRGWGGGTYDILDTLIQ